MRRVIAYMKKSIKFNLVRRESRFDKKMREWARAYRASKMAMISSFAVGLLIITLVIAPSVLKNGQAASDNSDVEVLYGVQDTGGADSQFFTLDTSVNSPSPLGGNLKYYDIEASDFHPSTGVLYAISGNGGNLGGNVYTVNTETGDLTLIGNSGAVSDEIVSASFNPDGTLWGFQEDRGLVNVDLSTGDATLVWQVSGPGIGDNWEGIAWDMNGEYLYGVNADKLIKFDPNANVATPVCSGLPAPVEALEFNINGDLIGARHGSNVLFKIDTETCAVEQADYNVNPYNDVETIAFYEESAPNPCLNNESPKAVISGVGNSVTLGETVTLDGSSSSDADSDNLTYEWKINGETVSSEETFTITPQETGEYTVTLTVSDGCASDTSTMVVDVVDGGGVCDLKITKTDDVPYVYAGDTITYTINLENVGSANCTGGGVELREFYDSRTTFVSSNPTPYDGDNVWNFGTMEPGESNEVVVEVVTDNDITSEDPDIYNKACAWASELGDKDDENSWICDDEYTPIVNPPDQCAGNTKPSADAGEDKVIMKGETVTLDGSSSSDADSDNLTYEWSIPSLGLTFDTVTANVTFENTGTYEAFLTVKDGCSADVDSVIIDVKSGGSNPCAGNNAPIPEITPTDSIIKFGESVNFSASGSTDSDADQLTYEWRIDGNVISTDEEFEFSPTSDGVYTVTLTVYDQCTSATTETQITVEPRVVSCEGNTAPIAVARESMSITQGDYVTFDGSGSYDADNDSLTYNWTIPELGLNYTGDNVTTQFNQSGTYTAVLTVSDGCAEDTDDIVIVSVPKVPGGCQGDDVPPIAVAGSDITVNPGETFVLDASGTTDSEVSPDDLKYKWSIDAVNFKSNDKITSSSIGTPGQYLAKLNVEDSCSSSSDELLITVKGGGGVNPCVLNDAPAAIAGPDITVNEGEPILLDGTNSFDPNGNTLNYQWEVFDVGFTSTEPKASLIIDKVGVYTARLTVRDQCAIDTDELQIRVTRVLGETFTPPEETPRAGAGIPTVNFIYGAMLIVMTIAGFVFNSQRRMRSRKRRTPNFVN